MQLSCRDMKTTDITRAGHPSVLEKAEISTILCCGATTAHECHIRRSQRCISDYEPILTALPIPNGLLMKDNIQHYLLLKCNMHILSPSLCILPDDRDWQRVIAAGYCACLHSAPMAVWVASMISILILPSPSPRGTHTRCTPTMRLPYSETSLYNWCPPD